jgi:hypothetical protein
MDQPDGRNFVYDSYWRFTWLLISKPMKLIEVLAPNIPLIILEKDNHIVKCYLFISLSYKDEVQHDQKQSLRSKFIGNYIIVMCIEIQPHRIYSIE